MRLGSVPGPRWARWGGSIGTTGDRSGGLVRRRQNDGAAGRRARRRGVGVPRRAWGHPRHGGYRRDRPRLCDFLRRRRGRRVRRSGLRGGNPRGIGRGPIPLRGGVLRGRGRQRRRRTGPPVSARRGAPRTPTLPATSCRRGAGDRRSRTAPVGAGHERRRVARRLTGPAAGSGRCLGTRGRPASVAGLLTPARRHPAAVRLRIRRYEIDRRCPAARGRGHPYARRRLPGSRGVVRGIRRARGRGASGGPKRSAAGGRRERRRRVRICPRRITDRRRFGRRGRRGVGRAPHIRRRPARSHSAAFGAARRSGVRASAAVGRAMPVSRPSGHPVGPCRGWRHGNARAPRPASVGRGGAPAAGKRRLSDAGRR